MTGMAVFPLEEEHVAEFEDGVYADREYGPLGVDAGPIGMAGCEPPDIASLIRRLAYGLNDAGR